LQPVLQPMTTCHWTLKAKGIADKAAVAATKGEEAKVAAEHPTALAAASGTTKKAKLAANNAARKAANAARVASAQLKFSN
jgi:hypothetical protein